MSDGTQQQATPPTPEPVVVQGQPNDGERMADHILESELRRAREEAADYRTKLRDMEKERDAALQQAAKLETEVEAVKASTSDLTTKLTAAEEEKAKAAEQLQQIAEQRHAEVLQRIPEEKREAVKDWDTDKLAVLAEQFITAPETPKPAGSTETGAPGAGGTDYDPSNLTLEQMLALDKDTLEQVVDKQIEGGSKGSLLFK